MWDFEVTEIIHWDSVLMAEKILFQEIALENMKFSIVTQIVTQNGAVKCCLHVVAKIRSTRWDLDGFAWGAPLLPVTVLVWSGQPPNRHPAAQWVLTRGKSNVSNHISVGLLNFSEHKCSQNILRFYMLSTVRSRVIKYVVISI